MSQAIEGYTSDESKITTPPSNGIRIFRRLSDSKYYAKLPDGTIDLIGGGEDIAVKLPARAGSVANVNVAVAPASIDGVVLVIGDRILLKNQTIPSENGIYSFEGAGNPLVRTSDTLEGGYIIVVSEGTVNANTLWELATPNPIVIGTTPLTFIEFFGGSLDWKLTGNSLTNPLVNFIGTTDAVDFAIRTNNIRRVIVSSTGQVGIGTLIPTALLDLEGTFRYVDGNQSTGKVLTSVDNLGNATWQSLPTSSGWLLNGNSNGAEAYIGTNDAFSFPIDINGSEVARFLYSATASLNGNFGVNTISPTAKVHIKGFDATTSNFGLKVDDSASTTNFYVRNDGAVNSLLGFWIHDERYFYARLDDVSIAIGANAGNGLTAMNSIYFGLNSGSNSTALASDNFIAGTDAGLNLLNGAENVFIGSGAGVSVTNGGDNVYLGFEAAAATQHQTTGGSNIAIGSFVSCGVTSSSCIIMGQNTGSGLNAGSRNTLIGTGSAFDSDVSDTVGIGFSTTVYQDAHVYLGGSSNFDFHFGRVFFNVGGGNNYNFYIGSIRGGVGNLDQPAPGDLIWNAGAGTGTGLGGNHIWKVSPNGLTSDVQNPEIEALRLTQDKNLGLSTTTFGANATNTFAISNGVSPTSSIVGGIQAFSVNTSDGTSTLGLFLEQAVEPSIAFVQDNRIKLKINNTVYFVPLQATT